MSAFLRSLGAIVLVLATATAPNVALAATAAELDHDSTEALKALFAKEKAAQLLSQKAKGVLVFPHIVKAGFLLGGQLGEGALRKDGKTVGYYNSVAGSYGLQAGVQVYSYALFFMTDDALAYLDKSEGWEIGVGPSIVVVEKGGGKSLTTTTAQHDVYAFIFGQKGLMAGIGIQGAKITKIDK